MPLMICRWRPINPLFSKPCVRFVSTGVIPPSSRFALIKCRNTRMQFSTGWSVKHGSGHIFFPTASQITECQISNILSAPTQNGLPTTYWLPKIGKKRCTCWQPVRKIQMQPSVWTWIELWEAYLAACTTPSHFCKAP
jgi:hypothetical protein